MNTPPAEQPDEPDDRLDQELAALLNDYPDIAQAEPHPAARPAEPKIEIEATAEDQAADPVVEKAEAPEADVDQVAEPEPAGLSPRALLGLIGAAVLGGLLVAGIGFYLSFQTVAQVAHERGGFSKDDAQLVPIGVDAGILVFLAIDLVLAYKRIPFPVLRLVAHALTFATVWFNASGGTGSLAALAADPLKATMHGVMPCLFVFAVEAARHWVVRLAAIEAGVDLGRLGLVRWLLAPAPTFFLWRRSKLWQIPVAEAVALEKERLTYRALLKQRCPDGITGEAALRLKLARRYGQSLDAELPDVEHLMPSAEPVEAEPVTVPAASGNEPPAASGKPSGNEPPAASGNGPGKASGNRSGKSPVTASGNASGKPSGKAPVTASGKDATKSPGNAPSAETREDIRTRIRKLLADGDEVSHAELAREFKLDPKSGPEYVRNQLRAVQRAEQKGTA